MEMTWNPKSHSLQPRYQIGGPNRGTSKVHSLFHPWGLLWNTIWCLAWHIWTDRNRRVKKHTLRPPEMLLKEVIKDICLSFRPEWHRKSRCHPLETTTILVTPETECGRPISWDSVSSYSVIRYRYQRQFESVDGILYPSPCFCFYSVTSLCN